jgi:SPP1 family predicted phage head-tail adaptor
MAFKDPGAMKDRVLIEAPTSVQDATGGQVTNWAPIAHGGGTLWARRLTEKGVEAFAGGALIGKVEIGFAIRYWPAHGLSPLHRFTHEGRVFNITSVVESERRQELVLLGSAGANRGQG